MAWLKGRNARSCIVPAWGHLRLPVKSRVVPSSKAENDGRGTQKQQVWPPKDLSIPDEADKV